jgi:hypothetical protein
VFDFGDGRARTGDPLLAKQVLCQLSYVPAHRPTVENGCDDNVERQRSVGQSATHPHRRVATVTCCGRLAWAFLDSNQGPHGYQPCALTN